MDLELITKKCTKCYEVKALEEFHKHPRGKYGRQPVCRACVKTGDELIRETYIKANAALTLDELQTRTPETWCGGCKAKLSSAMFGRDNRQKSGLRYNCRSCEAKRTAAYTKANPELFRSYKASRRAKKQDLFQENFTYAQIVERDGSESCGYCHTTEGPFDVDHIFPLKLGGWHTPDNLVLACAHHNRSKGAVHPLIYVEREGFTPNETIVKALAREAELTRQ